MSNVCQHPAHEGDRLIAHPFDFYVKKVTYRRIDAQVRMHEHEVMRLCRRCVEKDAGKGEPDQAILDMEQVQPWLDA